MWKLPEQDEDESDDESKKEDEEGLYVEGGDHAEEVSYQRGDH